MAHLFPGQLQVLGGFRVLYATIGVQALAILVFMFQAIFNTWQPMAQARAEVQRWREGHPGLVMGLTDDVAYPFTFYRLLLDGEQIDAPSYMDLHFSGVDDATLTRKMVTCQIPTLLLPVQGEPFSMNNWYVMSPLFSDQVRQAFAVHYTATQTGSHYALYTCHKSP